MTPIEAPADITAAELYDVLLAALDRCGGVADSARARAGFLLGLLATCVSVMRERGWTVRPPVPVHHTPIDPR